MYMCVCLYMCVCACVYRELLQIQDIETSKLLRFAGLMGEQCSWERRGPGPKFWGEKVMSIRGMYSSATSLGP